MELAGAIGLVGGLFGIVGVLAGAFAVFRAQLAQNTIKLYQDNANALEKTVTHLKQEFDGCKLRLEGVEAANAALAEIVAAFGKTSFTQAKKPRKRSNGR